jgi:dihydroxy-acid dehydratase
VSLERLNALSDETPILVDLKPTGQHYMSDLFVAGGIGAVLRELKPMLHLDCMTVTGETLGERLSHEPGWVDREVVRPLIDPHQKNGGLVALFGSLAPAGAILKRSAADPRLFEREARAVVFSSLDDLAARIDAPDLDVNADDFLVLQNAGPKSGYAMPEAGYLPIPAKLARAGVKDMVRISDARMSGTAYGTVVLHVSPEAAAGAGSTCSSARQNSPGAARRIGRCRSAPSGDMRAFTCRACYRRKWAATSISCERRKGAGRSGNCPRRPEGP